LTVRVVVSKSETGGCLEASAARAASYSIREFSQRRASQKNIDCDAANSPEARLAF
jgi:hypothetical protein